MDGRTDDANQGVHYVRKGGCGGVGDRLCFCHWPRKATGELKGEVEVGHEREKSAEFERTGLTQIVKEIGNSEFVVLVDDFHYMPRDVQSEAAKGLKEAVRLGVQICTAAVRHRGDDLVRANPELRGA